MAVVETFINDRVQYIFISKRITGGDRIINPVMKYNTFIKPTTADIIAVVGLMKVLNFSLVLYFCFSNCHC